MGDAAELKYLHAFDYVVFATMLVASAAIGIYFGVKDKKRGAVSTGDYLMASRSMSFGPVAFSLTASFMSSVTLLGNPAEYYLYGTMYTYFCLTYIVTAFLLIFIYIPVFYDLGISSAYQYLEMRFDKRTRLLVTCLYLIFSTLYGGIATYGPALALNKVTGLDMWGSIICTGAVCMFYTALGGLKAVIWTDVLQCILMLLGFVVIIIQASINLGGFSNIWSIADEGGRLDFNHFELDPRIRHTFWSIMVGGVTIMISIYGTNQTNVQRYVSCRTKRDAYISALLMSVGLNIIVILSGVTGLAIYATYKDCDPVKSGKVDEADQLFPYIIMDITRHLPGIPGLFVAAVYSGSLSTISSGINAMACATLEDFIKPYTKWKETTYTNTSRLLSVAFGVSYIITAYLAARIGGLLRMSYSISGIIGSTIGAVFTVGMLTSWVNRWGSFFGVLAGITSTVWVFIGRTIYPIPEVYLRKMPTSTAGCEIAGTNISFVNQTTLPPFSSTNNISITQANIVQDQRPLIAEFYAISYVHLATVGFTVTVVFSILVSLITGCTKGEQPDERLLAPFLRSPRCCTKTKRKAADQRSKSWVPAEQMSGNPKHGTDELNLQMKPEENQLLPNWR